MTGVNNLTKRWFIVLWAFIPLVAAHLVEAQEPSAGDAAHFLRDGLGARSRGMGSAFVSVASDLTASYWNPAGVPSVSGFCIGGTYEGRFEGLVSAQYLAGAYSQEDWGVGIIWYALDIYSVGFLAIGIRGKNFQMGATAKIYKFASTTQSADGFGFDGGILIFHRFEEMGFNLTLGFVSRDIGWTAIRWRGPGIDMVDHVAWVNRLGVSVSSEWAFGSWLISADLEVALKRPPRPGETDYLSKALQTRVDLGAEFWLQVFALRIGFADVGSRGFAGIFACPSFGVGVKWAGLELDAAWTTSPLGFTYLLSAEFVF